MSNRFDSPFVFYNDDVGRALANGQLYFYENGTTTPQNVFQEPALTNQHAFPVVADGAGIFPEIWLLPQEYTVELRDRDGNFIRSTDNVNPQTTEASNQQLLCANVADMKDGILFDTTNVNWQLNQIIETLGYATVGDGQSGRYQVVNAGTGTANDGTLIQLDNGLQAKLLWLQHDKVSVTAEKPTGPLVYGRDPYLTYTTNQTSILTTLTLNPPFTDFAEFKFFNSEDSATGYNILGSAPVDGVSPGHWQVWRYMNNEWVLVEYGDTTFKGP